MDPPPARTVATTENTTGKDAPAASRSMSFSQSSDDSQTAADFIDTQLKLEADAREALPYRFDYCTRPLGHLRQLLYACLTCNPPPATSSTPYTPAAVCYSCSVSCHGEHTLVELFNKRNFVCDCGTIRLPSTSPCVLRLDLLTNQKGVASEAAEPDNKYNHNFQNRFCDCNIDYDAQQQKGTMFQCLGLGTAEEGGCGEDWYHAGCVVGLGPNWHETDISSEKRNSKEPLQNISEEQAMAEVPVDEDADISEEEEDLPPPPGFPDEDDFHGFICYRCVDANPWIKRYAGSRGFLEPVFKRSPALSPETPPENNVIGVGLHTVHDSSTASVFIPDDLQAKTMEVNSAVGNEAKAQIQPNDGRLTLDISTLPEQISKKRKAGDGGDDTASSKRLKDSDLEMIKKAIITPVMGTLDKFTSSDTSVDSGCKWDRLPAAPDGKVSLFFKSDFREYLCRCSNCFPRMAKHAQLLEEEEAYEPPVSEEGDDGEGSTVGSGSLLDRGERALTNVDRVRAIEGVMAYNHLKEKLNPFFKEFAQSGKAISAEDIKAHFAKMRGDEEAIRQASEAATNQGDNRREQSGY